MGRVSPGRAVVHSQACERLEVGKAQKICLSPGRAAVTQCSTSPSERMERSLSYQTSCRSLRLSSVQLTPTSAASNTSRNAQTHQRFTHLCMVPPTKILPSPARRSDTLRKHALDPAFAPPCGQC